MKNDYQYGGLYIYEDPKPRCCNCGCKCCKRGNDPNYHLVSYCGNTINRDVRWGCSSCQGCKKAYSY